MNCNTTHYRANSSSVPGDPTGKYDKDYAGDSIPPIVGPKGKEGRRDSDHDGKPDWKDLCPLVKAPKSDFGCPALDSYVSGRNAAKVRELKKAYASAAENLKYGIEDSVELDLEWDLRSLALGDFPPEPAKSLFRKSKYAATPAPPPADDDADADGIWASEDACPYEAEDKDAYQDEDGCPDADNDLDGIVDSDDACMNNPEDKDGFEDIDGCPDSDNDRDGVADVTDKCTAQAETLNGYQDEDGCPDNKVSALTLDWSKPEPKPVYTPPAPVYTPPPVYVPPAPKLPSVEARLATGKKAKNDAAVVIGLEDYFQIPDVPYARRDADAFYGFLLYTRGVPQEKIQTLSAGGKEHIAAAVERAGKEAGPGGTVWVYFAGHGAANPSSGQRMLLGDDVRSDAIGFASRGIEVNEIERLAGSNGGTPMLVLDTCYSGAGRNGGTLIAGGRFAVPQFNTKPAGAAMEWNAASADQVSGPLEPVQHGAFTYFAVGALRGWADGEIDGRPDGKVTGSEAQAYVRRALRAHQKNDQQPVWVGPNDPVLSEGAAEKGPEF